ncbi:SsrA-binding protein SmpB [Patescibacteria group bacterium AH-259-L07]|nr:SsrA-binding protein SmpB [Patescibacteria group bacterium AH-259-L07]
MPTITTNKRAYHDYEIIQTIETGIVLSGPEVKSVKSGNINLSGSYATIDKSGTPWIHNTTIAPYPPAAAIQQNYDPIRSRKLLLHKYEIASLIGKIKTARTTLIPLKVYTKKGLIKLEIGLARGKKKYDKREALKKRDVDKKIKKALKQYHQQ